MSYYKEYGDHIIESCNKSDIDLVSNFLNTYWSDGPYGHILNSDKNFRDWQYYNKRRDNYNFLLAKENHTGDIIGIVGFTPTSFYDDSISDENKFIWLTTWMVHPDFRANGNIGIRLLAAMPHYEETENIGTLGLYDTSVPFFKMLNYETGSLEHYYCLNGSKQSFSIADVPPESLMQRPTHNLNGTKNDLRVVDWNNFTSLYEMINNTKEIIFPIKTSKYYINRYLNHPRYKYEIMSIVISDLPVCAFIFRMAQHENAVVLRIVDGFGDFSLIGNIYNAMQNLLNERNAEFIDIYCFGIDCILLENAGFKKHGVNHKIIIPHFYEPFVRKNRHINYAYLNPHNKKFILFRGDGDQDRPNMPQSDIS